VPSTLRSGVSVVKGFGNGSAKIQSRGELQLLAKKPHSGHARLHLRNACLVPGSSPTLISVPKLDEAEVYTLFGNGRCISFINGDNGHLINKMILSEKVILTGSKCSDKLYHLDTPSRSGELAFATVNSYPTALELLHYRFGHLNYQSVKSIVRKGLVSGINISREELNVTPPTCLSCMHGKMTRASFPTSQSPKASSGDCTPTCGDPHQSALLGERTT